MNKYDTVYVPDRNGIFKVQEFYEDHHEWVDVHSEESLSAKQNVICMTIEELRECFKWGMDSFEDTQTPEQSFKDYLAHKEITI